VKNFFDLKSLFSDDLSAVNSVISNSLSSKEHLVQEVGSYLIQSGGKRIRPILTLLFSKICGYSGDKHILLASAVELIHVATLLHDDVIDESSTRRNKPTANFTWGNKASILVGDFLFSQSFKLMVKSESVAALQSLSNASSTIAEGEVMQLARLYQNRMISIDEYEEIAKAKTAALFSASTHVGAIIANQHFDIQEACKEFGAILGLIFQITDDMLDYFSDPSKSGKNLGDDLAQGSITAPVIIAYNKANSEDKKKIEDIFFGNDRGSKFEEIKSILVQYDTESLITNYVDAHYKKALTTIPSIPHSAELTPYLYQILDYARSRNG
jgi:octaprenyl-diphosphate synthase